MTKTHWIAFGLAALTAGAGGCKTQSAPERVGTSSPASPAPVAAAEVPFEGEIQLVVHETANDYEPPIHTTQTIAYDIKGDKVRSQSIGDATAARVVGDRKDGKAFAVMDVAKSYATIDLATKAAPSLVRTGKVDRVLGQACEHWTITQGSERFDVCAAKGIAYIDPITTGGEPGWASVLTREHAFPLRVMATGADGKSELRAEAIKIDRRHLDDGQFKVPTQYQASAPPPDSYHVGTVL